MNTPMSEGITRIQNMVSEVSIIFVIIKMMETSVLY